MLGPSCVDAYAHARAHETAPSYSKIIPPGHGKQNCAKLDAFYINYTKALKKLISATLFSIDLCTTHSCMYLCSLGSMF